MIMEADGKGVHNKVSPGLGGLSNTMREIIESWQIVDDL
jgi:hypothetical protein